MGGRSTVLWGRGRTVKIWVDGRVWLVGRSECSAVGCKGDLWEVACLGV